MPAPISQSPESGVANPQDLTRRVDSKSQTTRDPSMSGDETADAALESGKPDLETQQPEIATSCRGIWKAHQYPNRFRCEDCRNNILSAAAILLVTAVLIPSCITLRPLKSNDKKEGKPFIGIIVVGLLLPFVVVGVVVAVLAHRAAMGEEKQEEELKAQRAEAAKV